MVVPSVSVKVARPVARQLLEDLLQKLITDTRPYLTHMSFIISSVLHFFVLCCGKIM